MDVSGPASAMCSFPMAQELLDQVGPISHRKRLDYMRCHVGVETMVNARDSYQDLFVAEMGLAPSRSDRPLSPVPLYKALGGGWQ